MNYIFVNARFFNKQDLKSFIAGCAFSIILILLIVYCWVIFARFERWSDEKNIYKMAFTIKLRWGFSLNSFFVFKVES